MLVGSDTLFESWIQFFAFVPREVLLFTTIHVYGAIALVFAFVWLLFRSNQQCVASMLSNIHEDLILRRAESEVKQFMEGNRWEDEFPIVVGGSKVKSLRTLSQTQSQKHAFRSRRCIPDSVSESVAEAAVQELYAEGMRYFEKQWWNGALECFLACLIAFQERRIRHFPQLASCLHYTAEILSVTDRLEEATNLRQTEKWLYERILLSRDSKYSPEELHVQSREDNDAAILRTAQLRVEELEQIALKASEKQDFELALDYATKALRIRREYLEDEHVPDSIMEMFLQAYAQLGREQYENALEEVRSRSLQIASSMALPAEERENQEVVNEKSNCVGDLLIEEHSSVSIADSETDDLDLHLIPQFSAPSIDEESITISIPSFAPIELRQRSPPQFSAPSIDEEDVTISIPSFAPIELRQRSPPQFSASSIDEESITIPIPSCAPIELRH